MLSTLAMQPELYKRHVIGIDSRDRYNGTPSNYRVRFPALRNVVMAKLLTSEIPNTEYAINLYNNRIDFSGVGIVGTQTAVLTPGTYSATELALEINTRMNAVLGVPPNNTFTVSYDSNRAKYTITRLVGGTFELLWLTGPSGPTTSPNLSAATALGFSDDADTPSAIAHTSDGHIRISGEDYCWLCVKGMPAISASSNVSDVFAKIIWSEPPKVVCYNSHQANAYVFDSPRSSIEELVVSFKNRAGREYDFNGIEHSFTIEVYTLGSN